MTADRAPLGTGAVLKGACGRPPGTDGVTGAGARLALDAAAAPRGQAPS